MLLKKNVLKIRQKSTKARENLPGEVVVIKDPLLVIIILLDAAPTIT